MLKSTTPKTSIAPDFNPGLIIVRINPMVLTISEIRQINIILKTTEHSGLNFLPKRTTPNTSIAPDFNPGEELSESKNVNYFPISESSSGPYYF